MIVQLVVCPSSDTFRVLAPNDVIVTGPSTQLQIASICGVNDGPLALVANAEVAITPSGDIVLEPVDPSKAVVMARVRAPEGQQLAIVCNPDLGMSITGGPLFVSAIQASEIQTEKVTASLIEATNYLRLKTQGETQHVEIESEQLLVGVGCWASRKYSVATGQYAGANLYGVVTRRLGADTRNVQRHELLGVLDGTEATWAEVFLGGQSGERCVLLDHTLWSFIIRVVGTKVGVAPFESAAFEFKGCVRREGGSSRICRG